MNIHIVLWLYIVFLVLGGLVGFLKAGSKVSLYMSVGFAAALALCNIHGLLHPNLARVATDVLMVVLLVTFALRLARTKKFMPAGMMLVVTLAVLALRHLA